MNSRSCVLALVALSGLSLVAAEPPKVLVFSRCEGFRHGAAIEACRDALAQEAQKGRYAVDFTNEYAALTIENLQRYRALVLNNTTALKTKDNPRIAPTICSFVRWGGGLCALHAAADNFYDAPDCAHLVGGLFKGHPWGGGGTWAFKVEDRENPVCAAFKGFADGKFTRSDEIYQQGSPFYDRTKLHVLISLDMSDQVTAGVQGQSRADKDNAVSWIRRYGAGRVFYTSFGHDRRAWEAEDTRAHMLAGLDYALGLLKADDAPSRPAAAPQPPKSLADAFADVVDRPYVGVDGRVREARYDALGAALGRAVEEGRAQESLPIAEKVFTRRDLPEMVRVCAARVLLAADAAKLTTVLADPSKRVRQAAFGRGLKIPAARFVAALKGASPELTRALVARLAQDGATAARESACGTVKTYAGDVAACAEGADEETAAAVARALGVLGGPAQVTVLEKLRAKGGFVGTAAEEALADMAGIGDLVFDRAAVAGGTATLPNTGSSAGGAAVGRDGAPSPSAGGAAVGRDGAPSPSAGGAAVGRDGAPSPSAGGAAVGRDGAPSPSAGGAAVGRDGAPSPSAGGAAVGRDGAPSPSAGGAAVGRDGAPSPSAGGAAVWLGIAAKRAERKLLPRWRPFIAHADAKVRKAAWKAFGKMIDETTFAEASAWYAAVRAEEAEAAANALWHVVKEQGGDRNATLVALWRKTTPAGRAAMESLVSRANALGAFDVWAKVAAEGGADAVVAKKVYVALADKVLGGAAVTAAEPKREKWTATASRNADRAKLAFDGKPETRWETGWKPKDQWFALDLGDSFFVETVTLDVEKSPRDTPKGGEVYVSQNGTDWEGPVATCDDKTEKKTTFTVARGARHLKFVALGEDPHLFWSIHEIEVKAGVDKARIAKIQATAETFRKEVK